MTNQNTAKDAEGIVNRTDSTGSNKFSQQRKVGGSCSNKELLKKAIRECVGLGLISLNSEKRISIEWESAHAMKGNRKIFNVFLFVLCSYGYFTREKWRSYGLCNSRLVFASRDGTEIELYFTNRNAAKKWAEMEQDEVISYGPSYPCRVHNALAQT